MQEQKDKVTVAGFLTNLAGITFLGAVLSGIGALDHYTKKTESCVAPDDAGRAVVTLARGGSVSIYDKTTEGQTHSHVFQSKSFDLDKAKEVMGKYCADGKIPNSPDISAEPEIGG